jgi:hypothetical protein
MEFSDVNGAVRDASADDGGLSVLDWFLPCAIVFCASRELPAIKPVAARRIHQSALFTTPLRRTTP